MKYVLIVSSAILCLSGAVGAKGKPFELPATDPAPQKKITLVEAVQGKHPRLLFTAADIPAMKAMAEKEGKPFFTRMVDYLPQIVPPLERKFQKDATDGQRQGLWRLPTVALHYVLTGSRESFKTTVAFMKLLMDTDHWESGKELDSGMSSANVMIGAALAYDWLYHDLEPDFREAFRKKLLLMARRQYYYGHLMNTDAVHYWQGDPANNHRWHRDAGMTLATLAVAGDGPGYGWILEQTAAELSYINKWLPEDGTSHESPSYMVFGLTHLCLADDAADRCLGTDYMRQPFFKNVGAYRLYTMTPGMEKSFAYGDSGEKAVGGYHHAFFLIARAVRDGYLQDGMLKHMAKNEKFAFDFGWFGMVWFDPTLERKDISGLPHNRFFGDMGLAFMRDGWNVDNVAMLHKCSVYGGYGLNKYRNENDRRYVNIAHDDPDANEIILYAKGMVFVKPDGYSQHKHTAAHNTILVNGKGQAASDSGGYTQPPPGVDLTTLSYMTTWKENEAGLVISEGEAGNTYEGIDRFRRSTVWVPGKYILVVDDIGAAKENTLTWMMQGIEPVILDAKGGAFRFVEEGRELAFNVSSVQPYKAAVVPSAAEYKSRLLGYKKLHLTAKTKAWSLATVFNAWDVKDLTVVCKKTDTGMTVTVTGEGVNDVWKYERAKDMKTPSVIAGSRAGAALISCGPADAAPQE